LLFLLQPYTTPEQTREPHAGARVSTQARGAGTETAVSWVPRPARPGIPGAPPPPERPEAGNTPEETAQARQRFPAAHDVQQASEEPPTFAEPQAHERPPSETLAPPLATPVPTPTRQATLAAEDNDTVERGGVTTPSVPHTPYLTGIPPSSLPPRGSTTA